jgi:hypothetical protein
MFATSLLALAVVASAAPTPGPVLSLPLRPPRALQGSDALEALRNEREHTLDKYGFSHSGRHGKREAP